MNKNAISIVGCGWLGLPLAEHLIDKGFSVKGSTTAIENFQKLEQKKIIPFQIQITNTEILGNNLNDFLNSDILIINFPPKRRSDIETYYKDQFDQLISALENSSIKKVLFVSSTSVYPDLNREIFENETIEPVKESGKVLKQVENLLISQPNFETTIIRFSGLIGYNRMPGRFLANKTNVENGNAPINVIHQDDCIELITQIIEQNVWGEVFNASSDKHPTRKEFYTLAANKIGLKVPTFAPENKIKFKIINSDKIKKRLSYSFKYPDPVDLLNNENGV